MNFNDETDFEKALITKLYTDCGWNSDVLKYKTEEDLICNWAEILFKNNRDVDRLGDFPLTSGEMRQILTQVNQLRTPLKLNGFINGKTITIKRDNEKDTLHFGKEVCLKIFDREGITGGTNCYQIAEQPVFSRKSRLLRDRRGDFMLLINGIPVIHVELKKSGIPISQACDQIKKYSHEGVFSGLFSLVQIFVAMTPEKTLYFANPGTDGKFNEKFYFHWADVNNVEITEWERIAEELLSIPMAHEMIGYYTIADNTDGILKVMRSYQFYAASKISSEVARLKGKWQERNNHGGYVWHTTGSGKTMTSFKSAQLIANSKDADKVVFLMDRIELGTQSLLEYRNFADDSETVQATENAGVLLTKLKSDNTNDTLIVTSIQKMSRIKQEASINRKDIERINSKRIVFIVDECHRSTFGEMLRTIKNTFPNAVFFGFTGTPIFQENKKKLSDTSDVFGNELHRYSIADGIKDGNVLGFDPYKVLTFKDRDLKREVALEKAKAKTIEDVYANPKKTKVFNHYMNMDMVGHVDKNGKYVKGIEDFIPSSQYKTIAHVSKVVEDIKDNWKILSCNGKYHAIFATNSIPEAINYYREIKKAMPELKVTALFDNSDNNEDGIFKEDAILEILQDYNKLYDQNFTYSTFASFKMDVSYRFAHKNQYMGIEKSPEKQLNLLIVVDQMLTGFDSKWINTLYLDKNLKYEGIIQAFSRTNRICDPDKPHGTIRYYRYPHTMEKDIEEAFRLYSGEKPYGLFVEKLDRNLEAMNKTFEDIKNVFENSGVENFEKLPGEVEEKQKFASLFKTLNHYLEAAKIQGLVWSKLIYEFVREGRKKKIKLLFNKKTYLILALRYKELFVKDPERTMETPPYEIEGYLTEINTGKIDDDYMNAKFKKYYKELDNSVAAEAALTELHKTFATLSQEEQKFALLFLRDVKSGGIMVDENKTFRDYIAEYQTNAKNDQIHRFAVNFGVDETELRSFMMTTNENSLNEYGNFERLKNSVNVETAKKYYEKTVGKTYPKHLLIVHIDQTLRKFISEDGFEVE